MAASLDLSLSWQTAATIMTVVIAISTVLLCGGKSPALSLFDTYRGFGRVKNRLCAPWFRWSKKYPVANTCQIPMFSNISDMYLHIFGYRETGLFVEIGAYDGESFSNTSGLADIGWAGHYVEPIPKYAKACSNRHSANKNVRVHNSCIGKEDGTVVELSAAGPFTSAVADEINSVADSKLAPLLSALGWNAKDSAAEKITATTISLNTFFSKQGFQPGDVDVLVIDVEGLEWPILQGFDIKKWKPKTALVEMQQHQRRYFDNQRVQEDARRIEEYFRNAGYGIVYRDVVNTVFIRSDLKPAGGD